MKTKINLQMGLLLLLICTCLNCSRNDSQNPLQDEPISFYSTPELYDLTKEWAGVFSTIEPGVHINILHANDSLIAESLDNGSSVSFVSGDFDSAIYARTLWKVVVGRDVIVPVIHSGNPLVDEIYQRGVSPSGFSKLMDDPDATNWGTLLGTGPQIPVHLYVTERAALHSGWAEFLESDEVNMKGIQVASKEDLIAAVQGDVYAIGICNLTDVTGTNNHNLIDDFMLLPIDKDGNGKIDYKENVYADLNTFSRGVWIGKYPRELSSNIYSVAASNPTNRSEIAFLKWIITRGQVLLDNHGYCDLEENERMAQVKWIDSFDVGGPGSDTYFMPKEPGFFSRPLTIVLAILLVLVLLAIPVIRYLKKRREELPVRMQRPGLAFNEHSVQCLPGLFYDKSHTWAFMDKDGLVKVGIDDFILHVTGPITRIKMRSPGERLRKGRQAVSIIQDGKQLDIYAPVSGIIREQNSTLYNNTSVINSSPCQEGWIYKIEPTNWLKEVQFLIIGTSYSEWLKSEFARLKEFLMDSFRPGAVEYAHVLQDGGELKDRILEELGPEAWEDFQTNFIDVAS